MSARVGCVQIMVRRKSQGSVMGHVKPHLGCQLSDVCSLQMYVACSVGDCNSQTRCSRACRAHGSGHMRVWGPASHASMHSIQCYAAGRQKEMRKPDQKTHLGLSMIRTYLSGGSAERCIHNGAQHCLLPKKPQACRRFADLQPPAHTCLVLLLHLW